MLGGKITKVEMNKIILDNQTSILCGYDECKINDGIAPNKILDSGVIKTSGEHEPISYIVINTANDKKDDFAEIVEPMIEWLNNNHHPHTTIIIDCDSAELVEGIRCHKTDKFIKD